MHMRTKKPKVLFVYSDRFCSCTHKRCFEILNGLWRYEKNFIQSHAIQHDKLNQSHFEFYDIILFQRLGANGTLLEDSFKTQLQSWIHSYNHRCYFIYDIDDLLLNRQNQTPIWLAKLCNLVLVPNEELLKHISPYQKCSIIRTHVNIDLIDGIQGKQLEPVDAYHIGWFTASANGFDVIKEVIHSIAETLGKPVYFHLFCISHWHSTIKDIINHPSLVLHPIVTETEMYAYMKSMDVIINPLLGHFLYERDLEIPMEELEKFMQAKSEIKYALAGACGVPLIVSPLGAYLSSMQHGVNGFFASSAAEWENCIKKILSDPSSAAMIAEESNRDVRNRYSLKRAANDYKNLFSEILI